MIITGSMGTRGTTFKSSSRTAFKLHLTDEFVSFGDDASASVRWCIARYTGRYASTRHR